jgi:hypothetical protein
MARIVSLILVFESERSDRGNLRNVFSRLGEVEVPCIAGQHERGSWRISGNRIGIERFAEANVE